MYQSNPNSELYRLFLDAGRRTRVMQKWHHYFDIYERFFSRFRGRSFTMLEIGVGGGGSLELWRNYFGIEARIVGLDIDPACQVHAGVGTQIFIGDQADPAFLQAVVAEIGRPHLILDDGGHRAAQQITAFETLYPMLSDDGIYMIEDTHTAFWGNQFSDRFDGQSVLDFAFDRCRSLHEWTMRYSSFERFNTPPNQRKGTITPVSEFCRSTKAISFFDSVAVFERGSRVEPWHETR